MHRSLTQLPLLALCLFMMQSVAGQTFFKKRPLAEITFRSDSVATGEVRFVANEEIHFKPLDEGKSVFYNYKTVKKVTLLDSFNTVYAYKINKNIRQIQLVKLDISGKINLYSRSQTGEAMVAGPGGLGGTGIQHTETTYYLGLPDSDIITGIGIGNVYSNRFKKVIKEYLSACKDLQRVIDDRKVTRYGIRNVIKYYNNDCQFEE